MFNILIDFLLIFLVVYLVYLLFLNKKKKDYSSLKDGDFVKIFVRKYNINVDKVNYKLLINVVSLINSIIIAFTSTVILKIDNIIWSIIVAFVILFILVYLLFGLAGKYFKNSEVNVKVKEKKKKSKKEDDK